MLEVSLPNVRDEQHAIHDGHAEQRDEADQRRHRQHRVGEIESEDAAHRRERHVEQHHEGR
jgi:hypothetical protein